MKILPDWLRNGYLRLMEPVAAVLARLHVHPNTITIAGTVFMIGGGALYGAGHISIGGWLLSVTALTDVLDGMVARRTNSATVFGAFLDSTLDRLADGAVLGGLAVFYALNADHRSVPMVVVCLAGIIGSFLTSYTRARAESLGIDAKVGMLQRPERVVLLSAPQALFGLALDGWVLSVIVVLLTLTAWITVLQRILYVYGRTKHTLNDEAPAPAPEPRRQWERPSRRETTARPALRGD
ncbi:MAG TPA: CDP-alcohol phosphatidyltransferase family protein [Gemmatimonadaceae bacterium]